MTVARHARLAAIEWSRGHSVIDVDDPSDLRYWCAHFECTGSALRAAVRLVGPSPRAVHARLLRTGDSPVRVFVEQQSGAAGNDAVA
jgi:hypothetical protein